MKRESTPPLTEERKERLPGALPNVVPFALLLDGFEQAVERLAAGVRTGEPADAFRPLFEALNWAVALDERVKEHWAPKGEGESQPGWNWRKEVPDGDLVVAVRFARNRVHHQWSDALLLSVSRPRFTGHFCGERGDHATSA